MGSSGPNIILNQKLEKKSYIIQFPIIGIFQKKSKQGDWGHTFLKKPLEFLGLSLYHEKFQTEQSSNPGNSTKLLHPLEIPRQKNKAYGNSTWFLFGHSWKFHFFCNWLLWFPHTLSSIPLEISSPQNVCVLITLSG